MQMQETAATDIRSLTQPEITALERAELANFVQLLSALSPDAWTLPTRTIHRTVYAVAAHVAGGYAAQSNLRQLSRQIDPRIHQLYRTPGQPFSETVSRVQIGDRMGRRPDELIAEIQQSGERAIGFRSLLLRPLQRVSTDRATRRRRFISTWTAATPLQDLWRHRLEIALASSMPFDVTADHDLRLFERYLKTAGEKVFFTLDERPVHLTITGIEGAHYRFGGEGNPAGHIAIPATTLARLVNGWHSPAAARERSEVDGDIRAVMVVLRALAGEPA